MWSRFQSVKHMTKIKINKLQRPQNEKFFLKEYNLTSQNIE